MPTILIMEDEVLVREGLLETLESAGYSTYAAADGAQGIALAQEHPFDLAIIDIFMPQKDGIAAIMEFKKLQSKVKIIAISGGGAVVRDFDYLEYAQALGAAKCFQKPIDPQELLDVVSALISPS